MLDGTNSTLSFAEMEIEIIFWKSSGYILLSLSWKEVIWRNKVGDLGCCCESVMLNYFGEKQEW